MTTPNQGSPALQAQIESVAKSLPGGPREDFRQLMSTVVQNVKAALPSGNLIQQGGIKPGSGTVPKGVGFNVSGANGAHNIQITNPADAQGKPIWHEVSYSPLKSFTGNPSPVVMPATMATSVVVNDPGSQYHFRMRSSHDQVNWSNYQSAGESPSNAGLVSSSAISDAGAFNQTNYGVVDSSQTGVVNEVRVHGTSGPLTAFTAQKGAVQTTLPSATIVGLTPNTTQYVGHVEGHGYVVSPTLGGLLAHDNVRPVGAVGVSSGTSGGGGATGGNGGRLTAI